MTSMMLKINIVNISGFAQSYQRPEDLLRNKGAFWVLQCMIILLVYSSNSELSSTNKLVTCCCLNMLLYMLFSMKAYADMFKRIIASDCFKLMYLLFDKTNPLYKNAVMHVGMLFAFLDSQ